MRKAAPVGSVIIIAMLLLEITPKGWTETGDTYMTQKAAEPNYLYEMMPMPIGRTRRIPMFHLCMAISERVFHPP